MDAAMAQGSATPKVCCPLEIRIFLGSKAVEMAGQPKVE
jgi:hypothetical protein